MVLTVGPHDCPEWASEDMDNLRRFDWNVALGRLFIATWGILANAMSTYIFVRRSTSSSFNSLLILLTIADGLFLASSLMTVCLQFFSLGFILDQLLVIIFPYFVHPCRVTSLTCSTYATVAIAIERYLGIYHPLQHNTERNRKRWPVTTFVIAVAVNLPRFIEVKLSKMEHGYQVVPSDLRKNEAYSLY